jgi:ubiquinone/menaquinone biosynthesis C-methylase UbiE
MKHENDTANEFKTAEAFSRQSAVFDSIYNPNPIIQYKRERTRSVIEQQLKAGDKILELNCGTAEDAIYFAGKGFAVHATDISEGMLDELREKVKKKNMEHLVTNEQCSFNNLDDLHRRGPYDLVFSNFGGLNCTNELDKVLASIDPILKPGGKLVLVIMPSFCLWEFMLAFKGKFKTAFRRFNSVNGVDAQIEGVHFKCWYHKPSDIIKTLHEKYTKIGLEGLCTIAPPSYLESFPHKFPRLYRFLINTEDRLKSYWPWRSIGDYFIISFRKNENAG